MKRITALLCATLVSTATLAGSQKATYLTSNHTALFKGEINTSSVTHQRFQPGSKKAPHPFYKKFCQYVRSTKYDNARGNMTLWFNENNQTLYYAFSYAGLSGPPIMMHFHVGKPGVGGPIVQTICGHPPPGNNALGFSKKAISGKSCPKMRSGFVWGGYKLSGNKHINMTKQDVIKALKQGDLYINIHTCLNELGEVRGQILPMKK